MSRCIVKAIYPTATDATSLYRGAGPLNRLEVQGHIILRDDNVAHNWVNDTKSTCLFVQRPYNENHLAIIRNYMLKGLPVWIDYDDDLMNVPTDNPAHSIYAGESVKKIIKECCELASVITVSTQDLKNKIANIKSESEIVVIPNAFMNTWQQPMSRAERQNVIMWRGSQTHVKDLMEFGKEIIELSKELESHWQFIGYNPWFITDYMPDDKCTVVEPLDPFYYMQYIRNRIQPAVCVVPLANNTFNKSKSNIAWIEATFAGAVCVVPDWAEWQIPALRYDSPESFKKIIEQIFLGAYDIEQIVKDAQKYITDNLLIDNVNKQRLDVLRSIGAFVSA